MQNVAIGFRIVCMNGKLSEYLNNLNMPFYYY